MARRRSEDGAEGGSERRCVATRVSLPPERLLRFVAGPDGRLVPDIRRKLPGRGVWVSLSRAALERAMAQKAFARSLKQPVTVPADLADEVDALLAHDCLQALAMANKAGLLVTGFAKVEAAIGTGRVAALIEASDGAEDGRRKLVQALRRRHGDHALEIPVVDCFASRDLELALGRELVIHGCLLQGAATEACLGRWRRLTSFRLGPVREDRPEPVGSDPAADGTPAAEEKA